MNIQSEKISYQEGGVNFHGHYFWDDEAKGKRPCILVVHDWAGCNDFAKNKAKELVEMGYVSFAVDMYGEGKIVTNTEDKMALMGPLKENRPLLRKRILAAFNTAKKLRGVDDQRIAGIGFCFGGLCLLDLARTGADIKAVVSFHGSLIPAEHLPNKKITAQLLVLHGYDDPMVPPTQVISFADEMTKAEAQWQINMYGHAKHGFMNPQAHDEKLGIIYNKNAAERAWQAMGNFFVEVLK